MTGAFRIGKIAGIKVYIHFTFFLIFLWIFYICRDKPDFWMQFSFYLVCYICLFTCVLMHEFGHALAARRYGVKTRSIVLLPIGGVAQLDGIPEKPVQELIVAAAGPLVNVAIVLLLLPAILFMDLDDISIGGTGMVFVKNIIATVFVSNIALVIFNLIPAFPMDGGRMLRAILALRINYTRSTLIAARIGQGVAVLFIASGVLYWSGLVHFSAGATLPLIGIFVLIGAEAEYKMVKNKHPESGLLVSDAVQHSFASVKPSDTLKDAIRQTNEKEDIIVHESGKVSGVLTRYDIMKSMALKGSDTLVEDAMTKEVPAVNIKSSIEHALDIMHSSKLNVLPVMENNIWVGIISMETIQSLLFRMYNPGLN